MIHPLRPPLPTQVGLPPGSRLPTAVLGRVQTNNLLAAHAKELTHKYYYDDTTTNPLAVLVAQPANNTRHRRQPISIFAAGATDSQSAYRAPNPTDPPAITPQTYEALQTEAVAIFQTLIGRNVTLSEIQTIGLTNLLEHLKTADLDSAQQNFRTVLEVFSNREALFLGKPLGLVAFEVIAYTTTLEESPRRIIIDTIIDAALHTPSTLNGAIVGPAFIIAKGHGEKLESLLTLNNEERLSADYTDGGEIHEVKYCPEWIDNSSPLWRDNTNYRNKLTRQFRKYLAYLEENPNATLVIDFIGNPKLMVLEVLEDLINHKQHRRPLAERIRVDVYTPFTGIEKTYSMLLTKKERTYSFNFDEDANAYLGFIYRLKDSIPDAQQHPLVRLHTILNHMIQFNIRESSAHPKAKEFTNTFISQLTEIIGKIERKTVVNPNGTYDAIRVTEDTTPTLSSLNSFLSELQGLKNIADGSNALIINAFHRLIKDITRLQKD